MLLAGSASLALADCASTTTQADCTGNCSWTPGYCGRGITMAQSCTTASGFCNTTDGCQNVTYPSNYTSCSTSTYCMDNLCSAVMDNSSCVGHSQCAWTPGTCSNATAPTCKGMKDKSSCTAMDNCVWLSISQTICGATTPEMMCLDCSTLDVTVRSAIVNYKGQTCTWPATGGYAQDFSATMTDVAQNSKCSATTPASAADLLVLKASRSFFSTAAVNPLNPSYFFDASSNVSCTSAPTPGTTGNSAASLMPGVAFLVVAALM